MAAAKPRAASERRRNGSPLSSARRSGVPASANRCSKAVVMAERDAARRSDAERGRRRSRVGRVARDRGGDHLLLGQSLDGDLVGELAGEQAERGVELVGGEKAQHVGGDALAETDFDTGCAWLKRASSPGTSRPPAGRSAPIQIRPRSTPRSSSTSARAASSSASTRRARMAITRPASVGLTRRRCARTAGCRALAQVVGSGARAPTGRDAARRQRA
jgi:hypothetical protein